MYGVPQFVILKS